MPAGANSLLPRRAPVAPLKTSQLVRFISKQGCTEVSGGGKGSHRKFTNSEGRLIVLSDRKDVSPPVLKSTAQALGLSMRELDSLARRG